MKDKKHEPMKPYRGHVSRCNLGSIETGCLNDLGFELGKTEIENC